MISLKAGVLRGVVGLLGLIAAFTAMGGALSGAALAQSKCSGKINQIVVQGNQRIEPGTITSYLVLKPGDEFDDQVMDLSLKTLFATGLFADVALSCSGQDLVVSVVENPIINRVVFEHNKALNDKELTEEIQLKPRDIYTRAKVQEDVQKLLERYRRSGRFAASVEPKIVQLPQNRVDLIYEISEGPVTGVSTIEFKGNKHFSASELRDVIATKESKWWNFFEQNDNYDPDRLAYDREQLRKFYLSKGFVDFQVVSAVAELPRDRSKFFITFTLDEGERYRVREVTVDSSVKELKPQDMRKLIPIKDGSIYNADQVESGVDAITYAAGAVGYAFVDVQTRLRRHPEDKTLDVAYIIKEGPRVYIERININGNVRTLDRVIRREFRLVEGDAYNKVLIERSRTRIKGLGFFKEVKIDEQPGSAPDKTVINVNVEEQSTGELSVGAGFSSTDNFITDLSISERNLLGRGQFLRLRLSVSGRRQQADIRFTEPYFLGRKLAAGFDLFKLLTDYKRESGFQTDSMGLGLRTGSPLTEFTSISFRYTIRQDNIKVDNFLCVNHFVSLAVCAQDGKSVTSVLGYTWAWNRLNDPIEPTSGWQMSLSQDLAGLGGNVNYLRSEAAAGIYQGLFKDVVASLSFSGGYIFTLNNDNVRLNDRFFKGGGTFRGFQDSGVGPRDLTTDDALGGKAYAIGTAELKFPLGLPKEFGIKGAIFSEFGTIGLLDNADKTPGVRDDLAFRASVGASLFWDSPFGPVRIDFATPLLREGYDKIENFRFSAGTRF